MNSIFAHQKHFTLRETEKEYLSSEPIDFFRIIHELFNATFLQIYVSIHTNRQSHIC